MAELFTALAGTFIASAIILAISFQILNIDLNNELKLIALMSAGSTVLYWVIDIYLKYQLSQTFAPDANSSLSAQEQYQIALWTYKISASIMFAIGATIALCVLTFVMSLINKPSEFTEALQLLIKFMAIAIILGVLLRFTSGFTTGWVKDFFGTKNTSLNSSEIYLYVNNFRPNTEYQPVLTFKIS